MGGPLSPAAALLGLLPPGGRILALVGAGGKTTALFALAAAAAEAGASVLVTATTHLLDPRREGFTGPLHLRPDLEGPEGGGTLPAPAPGVTVLLARPAGGGKLKGIHPAWIPALARRWDLVLVEADGARRLPLKAPGPWEPVLPPGPDLVLGVVGLDGLGRPLDEATVHRVGAFAAVTGCVPGAVIAWPHLRALAAHPEGLFKGVPGLRAVLLNKADAAPALPTGPERSALAAHWVAMGSLGAGEGGTFTLERGSLPWP